MTDPDIIEICLNETGIDIDELSPTPSYLKAISYTIFIFCAIYFPLCLGVFFYFRQKPGNKYLNLQKRNGFLVTFYIIGLMGITLLYAAVNMLGNENFPCIYFFALGITFFVIIIDTYICRVLSFYLRVRFNQSLIESKFREIKATTRVISTAEDIENSPNTELRKYSSPSVLEVGTQGVNFLNEEIKREENEKQQPLDKTKKNDQHQETETIGKECEGEKDFTFAIFDDISSSVGVKTNDEQHNEQQEKRRGRRRKGCFFNLILKIFCWQKDDLVPDHLHFSFFLTSVRFNTTILIFLITLSLGLGINNVDLTQIEFNEINLNCVGCAPTSEQEEALGFLPVVLALLFLTLIFLCLLRKYPDGLGVKEEITVFAIFLVFFNLLFVTLPRFIIFPNVEVDRTFDFSLVSVFEFVIVGFHSTIYQVFKIYKKDKNEKISLDNNIDRILSTRDGTKAYAMFLSTNIAVESLIFYKTVDKWENMFHLMSEERRIRVSHYIFEMFLTRKFDMEINIGWQMMGELRKRIIENDLSADMFIEAKAEALKLMDNVFYDFTTSHYYHTLTNGAVAQGTLVA